MWCFTYAGRCHLAIAWCTFTPSKSHPAGNRCFPWITTLSPKNLIPKNPAPKKPAFEASKKSLERPWSMSKPRRGNSPEKRPFQKGKYSFKSSSLATIIFQRICGYASFCAGVIQDQRGLIFSSHLTLTPNRLQGSYLLRLQHVAPVWRP